jgi:hypothetical protein
MPCFRYKISDNVLYRKGKAKGLEFTKRWPNGKLVDIMKWANNETRTIKVLSDVSPVPLEFTVRKFVPLPTDEVKRGYMVGKEKRFIEVAPYAIVNMASAEKTMKTYINRNVHACVKYFLRNSDPWIQDTYDFAWDYRQRHQVRQEFSMLSC